MAEGMWKKILNLLRIFSEKFYTNVARRTVYEDAHLKITS